jgi:hypothetical protein
MAGAARRVAVTIGVTTARVARGIPAALKGLPWRRIGVTIAIAFLAGAWSYKTHGSPSARPSDLAQLHVAGRYWLSGADPYSVIGPGRAFDAGFPLIYPLTAVAVAAPFALTPRFLPDALFVACSTALFVWAISADARYRMVWVALLSIAFVTAVQMSQWSVLLTGAALLPTWGFLLACKPTVGAALWIAYPSKRAAVGAAVFVLVTLALSPTWPREWLVALPTATHMYPPVMYWGGPLLLLAWVKWRRAEARLLGALALVPQTLVAYEALPLFLIPRSPASAAGLCLLTWVAFFQSWGEGPPLEREAYETWMAASAQWMVGIVYLPCLAMILLRPNTAD